MVGQAPKLPVCSVLGKKIIKVGVGCLNFSLRVTEEISTEKNWKYSSMLEKTSENCQCTGLKKVSQKYHLWGV